MMSLSKFFLDQTDLHLHRFLIHLHPDLVSALCASQTSHRALFLQTCFSSFCPVSPQSHSSPLSGQTQGTLSRFGLLGHTTDLSPVTSSCYISLGSNSSFLPCLWLSTSFIYFLPQLLDQPSNLSPCCQVHTPETHVLLGYHRGCVTIHNCQVPHTATTSMSTLKFLTITPMKRLKLPPHLGVFSRSGSLPVPFQPPPLLPTPPRPALSNLVACCAPEGFWNHSHKLYQSRKFILLQFTDGVKIKIFILKSRQEKKVNGNQHYSFSHTK